MSGLELADAVTERRPPLPVLFTSGHARMLAREGAPPVPPERVLAKPYTVESLAASIREALDRRAVPRPGP
jgi:CheY-like chemotaxis protein